MKLRVVVCIYNTYKNIKYKTTSKHEAYQRNDNHYKLVSSFLSRRKGEKKKKKKKSWQTSYVI